jgi:hypothetical protein
MLLLAIGVSTACAGLSMYSGSKKVRETQFHSIWFVTDPKINIVPNEVEFKA